VSRPTYITIGIANATFAAVCLVCAAHAAEQPRQTVAKYKIPGATVTAPVEAEKTIHLAIGLVPRDEAGLLAFASAVSDPKSPQFRHFLSLDQITERFGPTAADYQSLIDWAKSKNLTIEAQYPHRLLLGVSGRAADVEQAFGVKLGYAKRPDGTTFYRPDRAPSLDLPVKIDHVAGIDTLFVPKKHGGTGPDGYYSSSDLRNAYAAQCLGLTGTGQSVGIMSYSAMDTAALTLYESTVSISPAPAVNETALNGWTPTFTSFGAENTQDVEMVMAMAPGLQQIKVYEADDSGGGCAPGDSIFSAWAADTGVKIFSTSVGFCVSDDITIEATMAGQGQSVFSASGDYGTGFFSGDDNKWNVFLNSSITPVGGTALTMNGSGTSYNSEQGWYSSGGGVENFPGLPSTCTPGCTPGVGNCSNNCIPPYQVGVGSLGNGSGASNTYRNDPDIAMPAVGAFIESPYMNNGMLTQGPAEFCGTSASSPLMAGFTALAEQQNCSNFSANCANGVGLGFVSPSLYAIGLNAATYSKSYNTPLGSAPQSDCAQNSASAPVVSGYNLATGWGSPKCGLVAQLTCTTCNGSTATAGTPGSASCINFQTNSNHCGTCGNVCAMNAGCVNGVCKIGASHEDTHLITFDGVHYDFQASGDYVLARAGKDFEVQTRQASGAPLWPLASVNKAAAVRMGDARVAVCLEPTQLVVNGKAATLGDGKSLDAGGGVTVSLSGDTYTIARKGGETVAATLMSRGTGLGFERRDLHPFGEQWIDVQVSLGQTPQGPVSGLLGQGDGIPSNDIAPRDANPLRQPVAFTALYKTYGDSWRVPADQSILCATPKVSPSDPAQPLSVADLNPLDAARARTVCLKGGVTDPTLLEDCTLDTVVLDSASAAKAHALTAPPLLKLPILRDVR